MLRRDFSTLILRSGLALILGGAATKAGASEDGVAGAFKRKLVLFYINQERKQELLKRIVVSSNTGAMQVNVTSFELVDESKPAGKTSAGMLRQKGKREGVVIPKGQNLVIRVKDLPQGKKLNVVIPVRLEGKLYTVRATIRNKPNRAAQRTLNKLNLSRNDRGIAPVYTYPGYMYVDTNKIGLRR